ASVELDFSQLLASNRASPIKGKMTEIGSLMLSIFSAFGLAAIMR
ncbi:hypothetical protein PENNAL_c0187G08146, partial [Penicillium nalgiovense]